MTTVAERPAVFTGTPEQIITDIVHAYQMRTTVYIAEHLARGDWQLAEDLTQDTFAHLWRYHVSRGVQLDDRLWGLLKLIARQMTSHHLRAMRNTERPIDFTDPATRPVRAADADMPHVAVVLSELQEAEAALVEVAARYRAAVSRAAVARGALARSVSPEAVERSKARVAELAAAVGPVLEEFKAAAARVAALRVERDSAGVQ
ncbi:MULTISPECIES: hypothetical protein [Kitasatospora]|uniref:hypothetical protein n=1 Tax=Kitasatospora TaxID=2063 RepID=UPI000C6FF615|nr:hypothetical protein [Kitasatospora sp. GP30]MDH6141060.1 hypothetical protein [Kitasatospora sp. GP30]